MKKIITVLCVCSLFFFTNCGSTKKTTDNKLDEIDMTEVFHINRDSLALVHKHMIEITSKRDTINVTNKRHKTIITKHGDTIKITQTGNYIIMDEGYITVTGIAAVGKGDCLVEADSGHPYYFITDLDSWPKNVYGKKVRASGRCITVDSRKIMDGSPWIQGYKIKTRLENAKWEVIE